MKVKDIHVPSLLSKQLIFSKMSNVDQPAHIRRVTNVLRFFRNKKIERLTGAEVIRAVEKQKWAETEKQLSLYSMSFVLDALQNRKSAPCKTLTITCPCCSGQGKLVPRSTVDKRAPFRANVYLCENIDDGCNAYVGVHAGDNVPLGTMATHETRSLRVKAHEVLDSFWRAGIISRRELYMKLGLFFNVPDFHIGNLDASGCRFAIDYVMNGDV